MIDRDHSNVVKQMKYIGIAAYSGEPSERMMRNADCLLEKLAEYRDKIYIVLGGYWGFMKYIADRAIEKKIRVIFTLPLNPPVYPPNNEYTVIIKSDMGFVSRSTVMTMTSDILVALGGGIGSIIEIAMSYDYGKPIIVVKSNMDTDRIPLRLGEYLDNRQKARIVFVENGCRAADKIREILGFE